MILNTNNWHLGYDQILTDCLPPGDGGNVWILCNPDVDAMAAGRILSYMLRSDNIPYVLRPCWSYSSLEKLLQADDTKDLRALLLLNLGSSKNLTKLFSDEHLSNQTKIYVVDCRRPIHLANVHAGQNVVVFWDETQKEDDIPSDGDNLSGNESSTDEESEDDSSDESDSEAEFGDEGEAEFDDDRPSVDATNDKEDDSIDGSDNGNDQSTDQDSPRRQDRPDDQSLSPSKKKRKGQDGIAVDKEQGNDDDDNVTELDPRERHRMRRNRLRVYYSGGSFFGSPASFVAYNVATQKRFGQVGDLLWLACVGVADAYVHARLDVAGYAMLSLNLKQDCQRLFPNDLVDRVGNTVYAEHLMMGADANGDSTQVTRSDNGRIVAQSDFRFFLLRHTSLLESMMHSNYVSTRLQVWTNKGRQRLQELLAKMGFPLDQCRQPFAFLKPKFRRLLRSRISQYAEEYGLEKLEFTSFVRVTGFNSLLSACDVAYAATALLEAETDKSDEDAFHAAYDVLNASSAPGVGVSGLVNGGRLDGGIGAGIRLALGLQKAIYATAVGLVERKAVVRLRHFRYAFLNQADVFGKPLALTKLAHFLMDMHREDGKWTGAKARPLVLLAEKPETETYLVVGYEFPERSGAFVRNRFGQHFQMTASTMHGAFLFDRFDTNAIEVEAKDAQRFVEQLHYMMDST